MLVKRLSKYYPEVLIFGAMFGLLVTIIVPNLSWMMVNSDVAANILAAKYFYPAHGTGEPLYVLLNHLFLFIPIGTDSWRLGLLSTLSTLGAMIFIYLTVRELLSTHKRVRFFSILASLIFGSAMLVISQSGIVQLYALITMLSMGAFYFTVKKNWAMVAVMIGAGLAVHHLILITWLVLIIAHKELRRWKPILISLSFLLFYLYQPITRLVIGAPDNWVNTSIVDFFRTNLYTAIMLIGALAIWDLPARIFNVLGIVGVSLGLAFIPVVWWLWKYKKWKNELLWLFVLPILYYSSDLAIDTSKYMEASIGFGAIIAVLALSKWNIKFSFVVTAVAIGLLFFNINAFDIGRTLDPNLSAQKFYDEELAKIPDGEIFMTNTGWQWQEALLYNKEENRHFIPICIGTLTGDPYLDQLEAQGVKLERNNSKNMNERQALIAQSILDLNENVWMDISTDPSTYGAKVIKGDNGQIAGLLAHVAPSNPQWNFKPSNPYDMVTGAIQVQEWSYLTLSNRTVLFFVGLASIGLIINWFIFILPAKRRANEDSQDSFSEHPVSKS